MNEPTRDSTYTPMTGAARATQMYYFINGQRLSAAEYLLYTALVRQTEVLERIEKLLAVSKERPET